MHNTSDKTIGSMDGTKETVGDIRGDYVTMNKNLGFSYQINEAFVNNVTNGHHDQHYISMNNNTTKRSIILNYHHINNHRLQLGIEV